MAYRFWDFSRFYETTQNIFKKNVFCVTAYNQPYNSPLQICIAGRMHFSKKKNNDMFFSNWNKEPDEEKNYRRTEFSQAGQ